VDPEEQPPPPPAASETLGPEPVAVGRAERSRRVTRSVLEWVLVILVAVTVAIVLRTFVVQTFWIPSGSMIPTLQENDRVIVNKLSYHVHPVHRGDIVVFTTPPGVSKSFKDLVKRVIGLPGDRVSGHDGHVFVNGSQLQESYLAKGTVTSDFGPVTVAPNSYWVMGDNRGNSADSRVFGAIAKKTIVGRAFLRIWPLNRIGLL
jgi:signal peptidase I